MLGSYEIYFKFYAQNTDLIANQIAFRKRHEIDLGDLTEWEEDDPIQVRRNNAFEKGTTAYENKDMGRARIHFALALKLDRDRSHIHGEIEVLRSLAETFLSQGDPEVGIDYLTEAIGLIEKTGCQPAMRGAFISMADLCLNSSLEHDAGPYINVSKYLEFMRKAEGISRQFQDQDGLETLQYMRRMTEEAADKFNSDVDRNQVLSLREGLISKLDEPFFLMVFDALDFSLQDSSQADFSLAKILLEENEALGVRIAQKRLVLRAFRKDLLAEISGVGVMDIGTKQASEIFRSCGFSLENSNMDQEQAESELELLHEE